MDRTLLFVHAIQYLVLLLAISLHEATHAWTAARHGDGTATALGRASLSPFRHLDLMGSLIAPFLLLALGGPLFGWGRPTPVVIKNLKDPWRDDIRVTASGAVANLLLSGLAVAALLVAFHTLGAPARQAASFTLLSQYGEAQHLASFPLVFTLFQVAYLNAFLALFNLLPLPPLDGGQIFLAMLPPDWAEKYLAIRPYGFTIALFLGVSGALTLVLLPIFTILMSVVIQL